ncbi:hypothetical protein BJV74DRAFT_796898 [Russula compacta]|nr:hypothetical protein BJV74DRAFT_796898 [Russula compacta]
MCARSVVCNRKDAVLGDGADDLATMKIDREGSLSPREGLLRMDEIPAIAVVGLDPRRKKAAVVHNVTRFQRPCIPSDRGCCPPGGGGQFFPPSERDIRLRCRPSSRRSSSSTRNWPAPPAVQIREAGPEPELWPPKGGTGVSSPTVGVNDVESRFELKRRFIPLIGDGVGASLHVLFSIEFLSLASRNSSTSQSQSAMARSIMRSSVRNAFLYILERTRVRASSKTSTIAKIAIYALSLIIITNGAGNGISRTQEVHRDGHTRAPPAPPKTKTYGRFPPTSTSTASATVTVVALDWTHPVRRQIDVDADAPSVLCEFLDGWIGLGWRVWSVAGGLFEFSSGSCRSPGA